MHVERTRLMGTTRGWIVVSTILPPIIFALWCYSCSDTVLPGKGDFADVITVINQLILKRLSWIIQWAQCDHISPYRQKRKAEGVKHERALQVEGQCDEECRWPWGAERGF